MPQRGELARPVLPSTRCLHPHPTTQRGSPRMNPSTCGRRSCRRITTRPRLSAPLTANTLFAKSIPIVVTSIEPLAFRMLLAHPWPIARPFIAGGVHTISLRFEAFSEDHRKKRAFEGVCDNLEAPACLCRCVSNADRAALRRKRRGSGDSNYVALSNRTTKPQLRFER